MNIYHIRMISQPEFHCGNFEDTMEDRVFVNTVFEALQHRPIPPCLLCEKKMEQHGPVFAALMPLEYNVGEEIPCGFICMECAYEGAEATFQKLVEFFAHLGYKITPISEGNERLQ